MSESSSWFLASDKAAFAKKACQLFVETVNGALRERGRAAVAISGGETPKGFFEMLAGSYFADRVEWPRIHIFFVDERCVPPNHPDSNYGLANKILFSRVPLPHANIHRMAGEMSSPQEAVRAYENDLKSFFSLTKSIPRFDLIQLGMGEDGHTASLFPNTAACSDRDHWVAANFVEKFSSHRITLTFPILNQGRRVLFLVSGSGKAEMLKVIFGHDRSKLLFPVQMVQPEDGEVLWLFDSDAASRLPPETRYRAFHL